MASVKIDGGEEARPLFSGSTETKRTVSRSTIATITVLGAACACCVVLLGASYRTNVILKQQLAGVQQQTSVETGRAIGRIKDQLASETLALREQLSRTKADSQGADTALTDVQEDLFAALSRAQACEEAHELALAETQSLKVALKTAAADGVAGAGEEVPTNLGGVMAAQVLKDAEPAEGTDAAIDSIRMFEKVRTSSIG